MGIFVPVLYFVNLEIKDLIHVCTNINTRAHVHGVEVSRTGNIKFTEKNILIYKYKKKKKTLLNWRKKK